MIEEPSHRELVAELRKREGTNAAMVIFADRPDVGDLGRPILGKRLDVVELDFFVVFDAVVIDEAIQDTVSALLRQDLLLLGIGKLPLQGRHTRLPSETKGANDTLCCLAAWMTVIARKPEMPARSAAAELFGTL
jgi:hypothetical protein